MCFQRKSMTSCFHGRGAGGDRRRQRNDNGDSNANDDINENDDINNRYQ